MGHDVETLITFMRAMMVPYMWKLDPVAIPMPFREEVQQTRHLSGKPTNKIQITGQVVIFVDIFIKLH